MSTKISPLNKRINNEAESESDREIENISRYKQEDDLSNVYTVEEAVDKIGFGMFQALLSLFSGAIMLVEALEVMILAILSASVKCEWDLSSVQEATITTVVFFGFLIGNPVWGTLADKFGRKKALLGTVCWGFVFGIVSAFSPNYYSLLLLRGLVGFGFGGAFIATTYCIEFLPAKTRSVIFCLLDFPWAVGSIMEAVLALVVMTSIDHEPWRWLLGLTSLPILLVILLFIFVPESPRYLILNGKENKANEVLALIAKINCKQPLSGRLVTQEEKERMLKERNQTFLSNKNAEPSIISSENCPNEIEEGNSNYIQQPNREETIDNEIAIISSDNESDSVLLLEPNEYTLRQPSQNSIKQKVVNYYHWFLLLFNNGWWRTTLLLWYIWFSGALMYFGGTLLTTSLFQNNEHCGIMILTMQHVNHCPNLTTSILCGLLVLNFQGQFGLS